MEPLRSAQLAFILEAVTKVYAVWLARWSTIIPGRKDAVVTDKNGPLITMPACRPVCYKRGKCHEVFV